MAGKCVHYLQVSSYILWFVNRDDSKGGWKINSSFSWIILISKSPYLSITSFIFRAISRKTGLGTLARSGLVMRPISINFFPSSRSKKTRERHWYQTWVFLGSVLQFQAPLVGDLAATGNTVSAFWGNWKLRAVTRTYEIWDGMFQRAETQRSWPLLTSCGIVHKFPRLSWRVVEGGFLRLSWHWVVSDRIF